MQQLNCFLFFLAEDKKTAQDAFDDPRKHGVPNPKRQSIGPTIWPLKDFAYVEVAEDSAAEQVRVRAVHCHCI
jgi:hypothetical protein